MGSKRRRFVRRTRRRIASVLIPLFAPSLLRLISRSWKIEEVGKDNFDSAMAHKGRLATLWHGRMICPLPTHRGGGHKVLVSPSADGSLANALLVRFGYETIRGSSNKAPARAIREMLDQLERGGTIVITPDGPRGPLHSVNPGPAWMASETGFPILPAGCACDRAWHLNSWDKFTIPKPGSRVVLVYGEPIFVEPEASDELIAQKTELMRERMIDCEKIGFERLGVEPDW